MRLAGTVTVLSSCLLLTLACNPNENGDDGGDTDASGGSGGGGGASGQGDWDGGDLVGGDTAGYCDYQGLDVTLDAWSPGEKAFVEATSDWLLDSIGVAGTRLTVTDFDGDGWPDLVVRRGGGRANDYVAGNRYIWLLRNAEGVAFQDVTVASGFLTMRTDASGDFGRPGDIVAFGDIDNDGDLDAYHGLETKTDDFTHGETSELLLNNGDGTFVLGDAASPVRRTLASETPSGAAFADVDRDGRLDLWVTVNGRWVWVGPEADDYANYPEQDRLFRGSGDGLFTDTTTAAGLATQGWSSVATLNAGGSHTRGWGAAACDLNDDGFPELLSPSYGRAPNHLWQAQGDPFDVTFVNRSVASGYAYDGDLTWQEDQNALCYCQDFPAADGCAGLPASMLLCHDPDTGDPVYYWDHATGREAFRLGGNSSSAFCADLDNDGDIDLLTGEIKHWWAGSGADGSEVLLNETTSTDVTLSRPGDATLGLAIDHSATISWDEGHMTSVVFDFDNDGWPDIYQGASDYAGNHGRLYHQESALEFVEVPIDRGIDHHRSHGVVFADFDRDGDLDVVVGHSRGRCDATAPDDCYATEQVRFFENVFGNRNNWVQLKLIGTTSNRAAIGARVEVTAGGVTQTQEVSGGTGHYGSQNDLTLHFGLGAATSAEVTIKWPNVNRFTESFTALARRRYVVEQGDADVVEPCPAP